MEKDKKSSSKVEKLKTEIKELEEKNLRHQAEMANMRKRHNEEIEKTYRYDGESIIANILPIIDNFERALNLDDHILNDELSQFLSGFKMIYGNLTSYIKSIGVEEIPSLNEPFDPNCMEAVSIDHVEEIADEIVVDVFQKGYKYKDKVIRPAMVRVNKKEKGEMKNE